MLDLSVCMFVCPSTSPRVTMNSEADDTELNQHLTQKKTGERGGRKVCLPIWRAERDLIFLMDEKKVVSLSFLFPD